MTWDGRERARRRHRRGSRPRRRAAAVSTWARPRSATRGSRSRLTGARPLGLRLGERPDRSGRGATVGDDRVRFLPEIIAACEQVAGLVCSRRRTGLSSARPRRRPLGRARDARRPRGAERPRRRPLDRRPRRPEPPGDDSERQRPRDAACRRARPGRRGVRERGMAAPGRRSRSGWRSSASRRSTTASARCSTGSAYASSR